MVTSDIFLSQLVTKVNADVDAVNLQGHSCVDLFKIHVKKAREQRLAKITPGNVPTENYMFFPRKVAEKFEANLPDNWLDGSKPHTKYTRKYCTVLDLSNCFYSIPYSKSVIDSGYCNFLTEFGSFYWVKAAQGSSILPSFMTQYLLKRIYMDSENKNSYIAGLSSFYDDLIISDKTSTTLKEHFEKVVDVLDRITACGFSLSFEKSIFAVDMTKTSVEVLGFEISKDRISTTQKRKEGLLNSLVKPKTVKQLQSLNGILNYLKPTLNMNECKLAAELHGFVDKKKLIWTRRGDDILNELKISLENILCKPN